MEDNRIIKYIIYNKMNGEVIETGMTDFEAFITMEVHEDLKKKILDEDEKDMFTGKYLNRENENQTYFTNKVNLKNKKIITKNKDAK